MANNKIRTAKPRVVLAKLNDSWSGVEIVWGVTTPKSNQLNYFLKHGKGKDAFYTNNISIDWKIVRKNKKRPNPSDR